MVYIKKCIMLKMLKKYDKVYKYINYIIVSEVDLLPS